MGRKRKDTLKPIGLDSLYNVMTLSEASEKYHISVDTLREHIECGNLTARKSRYIILVSVESLNRYYKSPRV